MVSNCLIVAVRRYCRGGYLIMRRSKYGPFPHFLWAGSIEGIECEHFVPVEPLDWKKAPWWRKLFPFHIALFKGVIKHED